MLPSEALRIVDGFYTDPMAVRTAALNSTWVEAWGSWSGLHSLERAPNTKDQLFLMSAMVSERQPNWEELDASYQYWKKASCGGFAAMLAGQAGIIHAHRRSGDWAGVVYLSLPDECEGKDGTIFYRHRATKLALYLDAADPAFQVALSDAKTPQAWEVMHVVPMRFNRLILFNSHYFHGASDGFGNSLGDCRLTQVFNFSFL